MKKYYALVSGLVQGVGFRQFTMAEAKSRNLYGWVRNTSDGDVELEVEGPEETVEDFIEAVRNGSPSSQVENVKTTPIDQVEHKNKFDVIL
ncbi:acylphosphatase [Salsuginibacillus kocurii]|uniref:acylphosphatase n=1 Tax=Salsuginibacillus kocurii TaxID=427078 RepID=UPI00035D3D21|nr:acylphosphatase [Salsuginibacillus kocurii]